MEQQAIEAPDDVMPQPAGVLEVLPVLMAFAEAQGDISGLLTDEAIAAVESQVCEQYERDKRSRNDWETVATKALEDLVNCNKGTKNYPWENASNVHYPLLAQSVMQFNARAYPAIVKGDEAVSVKVVGNDNGQPLIGPQGPMVQIPEGLIPAAMLNQLPPEMQQTAQPAWRREPGAKANRASRVRDYMNTTIFYRMEDWESETDTLLMQMPAIGLGFRKTWFDGEKHQSRFVPALKLVVDNDSRSLKDAPQIAEEIDGVFPHHIKRDMATGKYRQITLLTDEDKDARTLIEAQCFYDIDGDGMDEPYIVTVDEKEKTLLRIVPDFGPEQIKVVNGELAYIDRQTFYTKYEFMPDPQGKFYNPGLAHILDQHGDVINTLINQMLDANHAATAGGGFIASGLRIQGQGQSSSLRFRPGEYKTVPTSGSELRAGLVERTLPQLSPVAFNLLDMILGAAKDLASIKDVLSGDASNNGQVGTTLALIEQGLQVFTAVYKRVYRGLKAEFSLLYRNIGRYATEETVADYVELLDDPEADFAQDFNAQDMDIRPVSDPSSVTKMQKMARAQFLMGTVQTLASVGGDPKEALRRMYEAADVEDIEKLLPEPQPNPMQEMAMQMEMQNKQADTQSKQAKAALDAAKAQEIGAAMQMDNARLNLDGWQAQARHQIDTAKIEIDAFKTGATLAA